MDNGEDYESSSMFEILSLLVTVKIISLTYKAILSIISSDSGNTLGIQQHNIKQTIHKNTGIHCTTWNVLYYMTVSFLVTQQAPVEEALNLS